MYRACSRCGRVHEYGRPCPVPKTYRDDETRKLRRQNKWKKKSEMMRSETLFCEICKAEGRFVFDNLEVHHIEKIRDNKDKLLDDDNLIVLCREHHRKAESGEISVEFLKELVRRRGGCGQIDKYTDGTG